MRLAVDGKPVFAATGGRPHLAGQPAVAFLHGAGMDHTVWSLQTRYFAYHGRNVAAVDLPGHGRSAGPPLPSVEALADWVVRLLDALAVERAALIGHSLGALVALEAAARHPERVSALALLGIAAPMPVHPDLLESAQAGEHLAVELVASWGFGRRAHFGGHRAPGLWMTGGGIRLLERAPGRALGVDLKACNDYKGAAAAAARLRCPAVVIAGAADRMTSARSGRELAGKIAGGKSVVIAEAGHMMMIEQPDRTLDALAGAV